MKKCIVLLIIAGAGVISCQRTTLIKNDNGVIVRNSFGSVAVAIMDTHLVHVQATSDTFPTGKSLIIPDTIKRKKVPWQTETTENEIIVSTSFLKIHINKANLSLTFHDAHGKIILQEKGRFIRDTMVAGEKCKHCRQYFSFAPGEALYGLGQYQDGVMNLRGCARELFQQNTVDVTPVLVSSEGYGLLWHNYSFTQFNDTAYLPGKGSTGFFQSEVADGVDYYFFYGPEPDRVIASYRYLTGNPPLYGRWAYGLWQCKEHYHTQHEILTVAREYRKRNIPLDNIVQDWFYWNPFPWGSHAFDRSRYPQPEELTKELHEKYHLHIMISVWAKFLAGSNNYKELNEAGVLYPVCGPFGKEQYYDPYHPEGRRIYWKQIHDSLYTKGFDAWWLDATEPEMGDLRADSIKKAMKNYLGSGARYLNTYSLMTTKAVYEGQRAVSDKKRVFILTRSAFAGQQRHAAASWSGDIHASWEVFHHQIAGGLNLCLSGLPYWTTDIGGFFVDDFPGGNQNKEYQELFVRWFQFGAFCPIFRVHGTSTPREMYLFGDQGYWAYDAQLKADQLRYRLLPYIYSLAWKVHSQGYTLMRALVFDFPYDENVYAIGDQFMFGPALLVNPVTGPMYHKDFVNIQKISKIIPADYLYSPDGKEKGLTAEYFNDMDFTRKIVTRKDSVICFDWGFLPPCRGIKEDGFSVVWKGQLEAPETGEYVFATAADDGIRLRLDDVVLIDNWQQQPVTWKEARMKLEAGVKYDIRVEYFDKQNGAVAKLLWITPSQMARLKAEEKIFHAQSLKTRKVYLPQSAGWYDFWTHEKLSGRQTIDAPAPIDRIPLYVKAGSIIPLGPVMNYATEKNCDPIEIRIYPGANASFTLYEDENDNYNYEKGLYATITFEWDNASRTLAISERKGEFPGMLKERTFIIKAIDKKDSEKRIIYHGAPVSVHL